MVGGELIMFIELVSIPVVTGIVQAIKATGKISKNYIPLTAIVVGVALGILGTFYTKDSVTIVNGLVAGLAAVGLFDVVTKTVKK